jgi:hypothetical protein
VPEHSLTHDVLRRVSALARLEAPTGRMESARSAISRRTRRTQQSSSASTDTRRQHAAPRGRTADSASGLAPWVRSVVSLPLLSSNPGNLYHAEVSSTSTSSFRSRQCSAASGDVADRMRLFMADPTRKHSALRNGREAPELRRQFAAPRRSIRARQRLPSTASERDAPGLQQCSRSGVGIDATKYIFRLPRGTGGVSRTAMQPPNSTT